MKISKLLCIFLGAAVLASCTSEQQLKDQMGKILKENPKILTEAIESNPADFMAALQNAAKNAQEEMAKRREEEERKKLEESFEKPLMAEIRSDENIRGPKDAPLTLVEYSDFECPFCSRGYATVTDLMKIYNGKIRFIYKHLPLSFHDYAMISAQYYEAIRLQDGNKAYAFHDEIFKNQSKLKNGKPFLDSLVKKVGADLAKVHKDYNSDKVNERIAQDMQEAANFGMQGTPGFLINGVPVRGAIPAKDFVEIIDELAKRGKVKL